MYKVSKNMPLLAMAPLVIAVNAAISTAAHAQSVLEEVVVTAQKREQGINDVGITVNAFNGSQLADFGVKSAEDLEQLVPGLTVTNSQPNGVPVYTIRGVGFNDFTTSASSTVGLYFDGASIPYSIMSRGALFDIARVEVLKGPQGDLYGRNTTAGAINFISNTPTDALEAGIRLDYDNYETLDLEGYISGPLGDSVKGRLAVKSVNSGEGWQESIATGEELGERDELGLRGILDFAINDAIDLRLNMRYFASESDNVAITPTAVTDFNTGALVPVSGLDQEDAEWTPSHKPQDDSEQLSFVATLNWDFGALALTSITSYDKFERDDALYDTSGITLRDADITNNTDIDVFSQELRLESSGDGDLYWTAGVFYSEDEVDESYEMNFIDTVGLHLINLYEQDSDTVAIFGHTEWTMSEQFKLTLGARYTEDNRDWTGCTYDVGDGSIAGFYNFFVTPVFLEPQGFTPSFLQPGDCAIFNDREGTPGYGDFGIFSDSVETEETIGKITLDYTPSDDLLIFATISSGFKSGGFNGAAAQFHSQLVPYDEETLLSYEIGLKSTLDDGAMQINGAVFFYDYEDKQELTNFITPIGDIVGITNVPESEVLGAELELVWAVTERFQLNAHVAWLDTEITDFTDTCPAGLFGPPPPGSLPEGCPAPSTFDNVLFFDASGAELDNSPEWQATATAAYTMPLSDTLSMTIAGDVSYKDDNEGSRAAADDTSLFYISDYTLFNARLVFAAADGKWNATLWGRNLSDEEYWHSANQSNTTFGRTNGMPRTYGVTFAYRYF